MFSEHAGDNCMQSEVHTSVRVAVSHQLHNTVKYHVTAHGAAVNDTNFAAVKVNCAAPPVRMEAAAQPMRKETGGATAGLTFQGSVVRSTTAQTTA